jgi:hypothetical protein
VTRKQIIALVVLAVVAAFFGYRIIRNRLASEESKIRKLIHKLADDFEEKRFKDVFEYITDDYKDAGNHTKESLRATSRFLLPVLNEVNVSIGNLRVWVSDDKMTAEAAFTAKVHAVTKFGESSDALTEATGTNQVTIQLRKEDGDWMIYSSDLREYDTSF